MRVAAFVDVAVVGLALQDVNRLIAEGEAVDHVSNFLRKSEEAGSCIVYGSVIYKSLCVMWG